MTPPLETTNPPELDRNSTNGSALQLPRQGRAARIPHLAFCCALALASSQAPAPSRANVVLDWNAVMMAAIRLDNSGPTLSTRNLAILHLAMYDAVNSITRLNQPYAIERTPTLPCSPEAAAAAAGHEVLRALYPGMGSRSQEAFDAWFAAVGDGPSKLNGIALGKEVARGTLDSRAGDGSATDVPYIPSDIPGAWRRTPPFFRPPLSPGWRHVRPFALPRIEPFVAPPPPTLDSAEYARDLDEVRVLGERDSTLRTSEETLIAVFWSDFSYTAMPPGHWQEIAATIARQRGTGLAETARLMALLSLVQADAAIVCWETKYRYNLWRPVTAIQRADRDGNPDTLAVPDWNPFLAAPPFPAYPSGHSTFSQASAQTLGFFYGTDAIAFTATSDSVPGQVRNYDSLNACAAEVGMSRIYGGIHFQFDNREGKQLGSKVATQVTANWLLPNDTLPLIRVDRWTGASTGVRVHGRIGTRIVLEQSVDLRQWQAAVTNTAVQGGTFTRLDSGGNHRFFRVRELPNPRAGTDDSANER